MIEDLKKAHIIGIGGIGISAIAKLLLARGIEVTGSDVAESFITHELKALGAKIAIGHDKTNIEDPDLIIYSSAVQEDNVERKEVQQQQIRELSYPEFLGKLSREYRTIVVTGTHGKSTTTAMLGLILEAAGMDPTVLVGSLVPGWELGNLRIGKSEWFVVEGCEYRAHMTHMDPQMVVLTNIEEDHLDYYRDLDHIRETFQKFINNKKTIWNKDDAESLKLLIKLEASYALKADADYTTRNRESLPGEQTAYAFKSNRENAMGQLQLFVPGEYNLSNAMAAITAAMELGVSFEICRDTLAKFAGIWRRFERVGEFNQADIISDYGHHPTAITETIKAARDFFPDRRIVLCFQPHQHSRTKELLNEFADAIVAADVILVPEIYGVVGRTEPEEKEISSQDLVKAAKTVAPKKQIEFALDLESAEARLRELIEPEDLVLIAGAGDVDQIARNLIS